MDTSQNKRNIPPKAELNAFQKKVQEVKKNACFVAKSIYTKNNTKKKIKKVLRIKFKLDNFNFTLYS